MAFFAGVIGTCVVYETPLAIISEQMKEMINQGLYFWTPLGEYCPIDPWPLTYASWRVVSNDAVSGKDMPFGVRKQKFNIYTPVIPQNAIFGPDFDGTKNIFDRKPLYNGGAPM